jgi:hypothetical protein
MKHVVTKLEGKNKPIMFNHVSLGNYFVDTFFVDFHVDTLPYTLSPRQSEIFNCTQTIDINCNIIETKDTNVDSVSNFWNLHFYGSKSKEGVGSRSILIDPQRIKTLITCHLQFECTNNTVEYEALI